MSDEADLTPKAALPITQALVLHEFRDGQPWPVLAVEFREDGHVMLKGPDNARRGLEFFIRGARRVMRQIAEADLRTALSAPETTTAATQGGPTKTES